VNIAGGLHHAMRAHASGVCGYNDPAVAVAWLLDAGARRTAVSATAVSISARLRRSPMRRESIQPDAAGFRSREGRRSGPEAAGHDHDPAPERTRGRASAGVISP